MLLADAAQVEAYTEPTLLQVILIYAGIPLLVIVVVVLLVSAPSWTRKGRHQPGAAWEGDALVLGSSGATAPALPDAAAAVAEAGEGGRPGGSSATW